jgi:hypothetical protein
LVKSKQSNLVRFKKKVVFCLDHPGKDFKSVILKMREVRIGLIILFNLLNIKFKSENKFKFNRVAFHPANNFLLFYVSYLTIPVMCWM